LTRRVDTATLGTIADRLVHAAVPDADQVRQRREEQQGPGLLGPNGRPFREAEAPPARLLGPDGRPLRPEPAQLRRDERAAQCAVLREVPAGCLLRVELLPLWRTAEAVAVARGIDASARFDDLPVLADALEEAGCSDANLLAHLRGPGPHARGCWALDLVRSVD